MRAEIPHWAGLLAVLCTLPVRAAIAHAQSEASTAVVLPGADAGVQARDLFDQGVVALANQRWLDAEALFRRSAELVPRSSSLYNLALALFQLHRYRQCVEVSDQTLASADERDLARFRDLVQRLRDKAIAAQGVYLLSVVPADASVSVDGAPTAGGAQRRLVLDPGVHRIAGFAPGYAPQELMLEAISGKQASKALVLAPLTPAPSAVAPAHPPATAVTSSSPWPALVVISVGGALLVGALVTGLMANASDDEFARKCGGNTNCDPGLKPLQRRTERQALASDILLATGAAAVGTGITIFLLTDHESAAGDERPAVALHGLGAGVRGSW